MFLSILSVKKQEIWLSILSSTISYTVTAVQEEGRINPWELVLAADLFDQ